MDGTIELKQQKFRNAFRSSCAVVEASSSHRYVEALLLYVDDFRF